MQPPGSVLHFRDAGRAVEILWRSLALAPRKLAGKIIKAGMEMLFQFDGLRTAALAFMGDSS